MNIVEFALNEVEQRIPIEVLTYAFVKKNPFGMISPVFNIRTQIRNKVIIDRVLPIFNVKGGEEVIINLSEVPMEVMDEGNHYVWRIPKSLTKGRSISSILNVSFKHNFGSMAGQALNAMHGGSVEAVLQHRIINGSGIPEVSSTADLFIAADNVIVSTLPLNTSSYTVLRCLLDYDVDLTGMNQRFALLVAKYVVLATKAYIYRTSAVSLDEGVLHMGKEVGKLKEIIESYEDAEELFDEMTDEVVSKMLILADPLRRQRRYKMGVGGGYV